MCYCIKKMRRAHLNKITSLNTSELVTVLAESEEGSVALCAAALAQLRVLGFGFRVRP